MATIGVRNRRLRELQGTVSDGHGGKCDPACRVVNRPQPSRVKFFTGAVSPAVVQVDPPCTELTQAATEHSSPQMSGMFQAMAGFRDGGELGGRTLEHVFLIACIGHQTPNYSNPLTLTLTFTHNPMQPEVMINSVNCRFSIRMRDEVDGPAYVFV